MSSDAASFANSLVKQGRSKPSRGPLDAHEKQAFGRILMLIGVGDIRSVLEQQTGNLGDQPFAVRTVDEEDRGIGHHEFSVSSNRQHRLGRRRFD